jgi:hypothetical protein
MAGYMYDDNWQPDLVSSARTTRRIRRASPGPGRNTEMARR